MSAPVHPPSFTFADLVAVALGAVAGAWARWAIGIWFNDPAHPFPIGTLIVNLAGGLLVGMAVAWFSHHPDLAPAWRLLIVTGFLGALTTFSSFSIESLGMIERAAFGWAIVHTLAHVVGSFTMAALGYRLLS